MDLNWAFSITDALVDGLVLGFVFQYFSHRQAKKDQQKLEDQQEKLKKQEEEDSQMLDEKLDKLYDRIVNFEKKHDDDVE